VSECIRETRIALHKAISLRDSSRHIAKSMVPGHAIGRRLLQRRLFLPIKRITRRKIPFDDVRF
jgi:hypothetical protein